VSIAFQNACSVDLEIKSGKERSIDIDPNMDELRSEQKVDPVIDLRIVHVLCFDSFDILIG
jgi:hypothetical protein